MNQLGNNSNNDRPITLPPISSLDVRFTSNTPNRSTNVSTSLPSPPMPTAVVQPPLACFDQPPHHHYYPSAVAAPYIQPKPTLNTKELASHRRMQEDMDHIAKHCLTIHDTVRQQRLTTTELNSSHQPWLDDMITEANELLNALLRIQKQQLFSQQQATPYLPAVAINQQDDDDDVSSNNSSNNNNEETTSQRRKRRKRAPFQGRCHACNSSETPEWRRGPDGARTLCNACGLHYAKMERKRAAAAAAAAAVQDQQPSQQYHKNGMSSPFSSASSTSDGSVHDDIVLTP
ncbi:predicted protein [Lichtheimia corymbifera JMRC:FSU:9682]|uniref:GATA-type domain-containing protein n=1 Tax=Lichtheimia corymbifera JMRC:FSU:9682 TaxID=1263082 RepID=A0A068RWP0_9FUNG|nr:predicted protein [Lichtheimia corymbifera JMRC:FSU:9682]